MNPPYGRTIGSWMAKAHEASQRGATVVCLVPARTDTQWFHDHVLTAGAEIRFMRGRVKFGDAANGAPFASLLVIYRPTTSRTVKA
jgi:site-specific DNA-methyltransferase (adenine-specific)